MRQPRQMRDSQILRGPPEPRASSDRVTAYLLRDLYGAEMEYEVLVDMDGGQPVRAVIVGIRHAGRTTPCGLTNLEMPLTPDEVERIAVDYSEGAL